MRILVVIRSITLESDEVMWGSVAEPGCRAQTGPRFERSSSTHQPGDLETSRFPSLSLSFLLCKMGPVALPISGSMSGAQYGKRECLSLAPAAWLVAARPGIRGQGRARGCWSRKVQEGQRPELEGSAAEVCAGTPEGKTSSRRGGQLACPQGLAALPPPVLDERRP